MSDIEYSSVEGHDPGYWRTKYEKQVDLWNQRADPEFREQSPYEYEGDYGAFTENYEEYLGQETGGEGYQGSSEYSQQDTINYWEDPLRVARYYNAIQTAPDNWQPPDWLDVNGVEAAYKWFEMKNQGDPWYNWQPLAEDDPALPYLRTLPVPPVENLYPRDEKYTPPIQLDSPIQPLQPGTQVVPYASPATDIYGQQPVSSWEDIPGWQRGVMTLTSPQPMTGRPEESRIAAAGVQGVMSGIGIAGAFGIAGAIIGGIAGSVAGGVGAVPGAIAGAKIGTTIGAAAAVPIGAAQTYAAYSGEEIPALDQILQPFNWLAEGTERSVGLAKLATVEGMGRIFSELPWNTAEWKAAALTYETQQTDLLNIIAMAAGDQPAGAGEVWKFTEGYVDPIPLLNQERDAEGARGVEALQEARDRIAAGEDPHEVWMDFNDRFGDTGALNDFTQQLIFDPLNYVPFLQGKTGEIISKKIGKPELAKAFKASQGNILIDALPMGLQQLAEVVTKKQGSTGLVTALRNYGDMVRGGAYPGAERIPQVSELDWFDRAVAGLDEQGRVIELTAKEKPNFLQRLKSLRPESQAILLLDNFSTNVGRMAFDLDDPSLDNIARTDRFVKFLRQYGNVENVQVGDLGEAILKSPMTATTAAAMKAGISSGKFEEMLGQWVNPHHQKAVTALHKLAEILETHPSKLVEDLKDNPANVFNALITAAENSQSPEAMSLLQDAQIGRLTPEILSDQFAAFTGEKTTPDGKTTIPRQPWTFEEWRASISSVLLDYARDWAVKNYKVEQSPTFFRFANVLKSVQSMLLLDLNPGYLANNVLNDWASRATEGVFGFLTGRQVDDWNQRFGAKPVRLSQGITPSGIDVAKESDVLGASYVSNVRSILDQAIGDDNLARTLRSLNKIRNKFGVISKLSGKMEALESRNAYTIGMQRMWDRLWRPGVGYKKMDVALEASLRAIDPRLPDYVYNAINSGLNAAEVEKNLFSAAKNIVVNKHIDDAARKIMPDNPDLGRELIKAVGLQDAIENSLKNVKTPVDVERAFDGIDNRLQDYLDKRVAKDISIVKEDVINRVRTEGFTAAADVFGEAQMSIWERHLSHFMEISELVENTKDATQVERHAAWRQQNARESLEWKRVQDFEVQVYAGIIEALGVNTNIGKEFVDMVSEQSRSWRDFYDGYDVNVITGERINLVDAQRQGIQTMHVKGKNDLQRDFYTREYTSNDERNAAYKQLKLQISELAKSATETEVSLQAKINDLFASLFDQTPESQQMAKDWRVSVSEIRAQMIDARDKFIEYVNNTEMTAEDKRKAWSDFLKKVYTPLIGKIHIEEMSGAQNLVVKAAEELNPKPPSVREVPPDDVSIGKAADILEEADRIKTASERRYEAKLARDDVISQLQKTKPMTSDEIETVKVIMDLYAERWAERTGKDASEWWNRIAGIIPGDDIAGLKQPIQDVLSLAKQYDIPTATKAGKPNNRQIINIVKKHGGKEAENIKRIDDISIELARKAFEAQRSEKEKTPATYDSAKGAVIFLDDGRAVIRLMKSADISTVIHELGHIYRRDLSATDIDTVAKWAGLKDGDELTNMQRGFDDKKLSKSDNKRYAEAEEKFARAFERYLAGEIDIVPPKMQSIFEQLKQWLVKIYKGITGSAIDVEISPEIRGVFDRMLFEENSKALYDDIGLAQGIETNNAIADALTRDVEGQDIIVEHIEQPPRDIPNDIQKRLYQAEPPDNHPLGSTPAPLYEGIMLDEVNIKHLRDLLKQIRDEAKASVLQKPVSWSSELPDNINKAIRDYWNSIRYTDMPASKLATTRFGEQMRDMSLLNYNRQHGIDSYLNLVYPYQFWYTRTMMNWAQRMIDKPAIYAMYEKLKELQRKYEARGVPSRLRSKMRVPAPYLPDWAGGTLYFDPLKQIFPFDQFGQPLEQMQMERSQQNQRAIEILKEQVETGRISSDEYSIAVKSKSGYEWNKAYNQAGAEIDSEVGNPMNMVNMMMSPALYLTVPYNIYKGTPEKISMMPLTRTAGAIETALQDTPLQPIGNVLGMAAGPERFIRQKAGLSEFGEWGDYYVDRQLSNMAADGVITTDAALTAMIEKQGEAYDQAVGRVRQELMLRTQGLLPIQAAKGFAERSANMLELIMSLPLGLFSQGLLPTGELEQRNLKESYQQAWDRKDAGDVNAVSNWFKEHPEYEARLSLWDEPEERLRNFLVSEIWDRYHELEGGNKKLASEQMGESFEDVFLNPETRDYTSIDIQTLAYWTKLLGGYVPKTQETQQIPMYQQKELELIPQETARIVQRYWDEREKAFPGIMDVQETYYNSGKSKSFLKQHPELKKYWEWSDDYKKRVPALAVYLEYPAERKEYSSEIDEYYDLRDKLYPNISAIQQMYYDSGKNKEVLYHFPELKSYWDWNRKYKQDHPVVDKYIEEQKKNYDVEYGGKGLEKEKMILTPDDFSEYDAILMRQIAGYVYSGQRLSDGAREELHRIWEKDKPGGSFEEYLRMVKEYFGG